MRRSTVGRGRQSRVTLNIFFGRLPQITSSSALQYGIVQEISDRCTHACTHTHINTHTHTHTHTHTRTHAHTHTHTHTHTHARTHTHTHAHTHTHTHTHAHTRPTFNRITDDRRRYRRVIDRNTCRKIK